MAEKLEVELSKMHPVGFVDKMYEFVPKPFIGVLGVIVSLFFALKLVGLDLVSPLNNVTQAYSKSIERQLESIEKIDDATVDLLKAVQLSSDALAKQQVALDKLNTFISEQDLSLARLAEKNAEQDGRINKLESSVGALKK
jgi:uncharacterized coiled-coil protein SlyX